MRLIILVLLAFTSTSDAGPVCAKACRKFASCGIASYDLCMDACAQQGSEATAAARQSTLAQANMSCSALARTAGPTDWLCTAEAGYSTGYSGGTTNERGVHQFGNGRTRSAAATQALRNCRAVLSMNLGIQGTTPDSDTQGRWEAETTSGCRITRCVPPARRR